jgi:ferredoxin-NADP reductase
MSGWLIGTVTGLREETPKARTLGLDVPGWMGNEAGQHLDVRLTAPDGYQAARSYSVATAGSGQALEISVDEIADGEVSPYLVHGLSAGDKVEVRGPLGRWFVWRATQTEPVQLIGGGSGVAPLRAMLRAHKAAESTAPMRLLYSVRSPAAAFYREELERLAASESVRIDYAYTRETPPDWPVPAGRLSKKQLAELTVPADQAPTVYVCGPTSFVEAVADWLVELGHDAANIRTERFGGT